MGIKKGEKKCKTKKLKREGAGLTDTDHSPYPNVTGLVKSDSCRKRGPAGKKVFDRRSQRHRQRPQKGGEGSRTEKLHKRKNGDKRKTKKNSRKKAMRGKGGFGQQRGGKEHLRIKGRQMMDARDQGGQKGKAFTKNLKWKQRGVESKRGHKRSQKNP